MQDSLAFLQHMQKYITSNFNMHATEYFQFLHKTRPREKLDPFIKHWYKYFTNSLPLTELSLASRASMVSRWALLSMSASALTDPSMPLALETSLSSPEDSSLFSDSAWLALISASSFFSMITCCKAWSWVGTEER